ncbi:disease resistance protein RPV1-like [Macadamia integrifolia]|uniref:disease resistance protein RPV1-like n=1 Tax=Macadamia integrifolia TaxID=60698 RepID=UPI001C4EB0F2|nr:disease resistance protein RPV1-like [Macadamia integrifolia]XP_042507029.1 disease resistance protein RPV1-like [Macadamia integrifolia]XP_042507036.1 disease resistance protein RPV1-like [Macadamia integrifolia]
MGNSLFKLKVSIDSSTSEEASKQKGLRSKRGRIKSSIMSSLFRSVSSKSPPYLPPLFPNSSIYSSIVSLSRSSSLPVKTIRFTTQEEEALCPETERLNMPFGSPAVAICPSRSSAMHTQASSSSSPASPYDVFLSFRGEDTRLNFTSQLYEALVEKGIHTFMDRWNRWREDEIGPGLVRAIEGCKVSIPILSKGYASSKRCLQELLQILECRRTNNQLVWPIFFEVEPMDVKRQTGSFKEPFEKYELEYDADIVERWREALRELSSIEGFLVNERVKFETITLIVEMALVGCHLVGINFHMDRMLHLLHLDSMDVCFVGICGPCRIGKTSVAEAVYNRIFNRFKRSSFLANVNARAGIPMGLVSLQSQLISDTLEVEIEIRNVHIGSMIIKEKLRAEKVLIVLDDLGDYTQINALVGDANWFGPGSRIIIVTTDERILHRCNVDQIYWPEDEEYQSLGLVSELFQHSINEVERTSQKIKEAFEDKLQITNLLQYRKMQIDTVENSYFYISLFSWKQFKELTVLDLSHCSSLVKIPDISSLQCLKRLILEYCCELVDVHESIGMIKGLIYLNLRCCCKLMQLQGSIFQLGALENLILSNCESVKKLPESSSHLKSLVELSLNSTKISELPDDVGLMEKLVTLNVNGCTNLVKLPRSMEKMRQLQHFNMSRTSIVELPDDFLMLSSLKILEMAKCTKLKGFPSNKKYNSGVCCLSHLQVLDLEHCKRLESLPEFSSTLLQLYVMGCGSLQVIDLYNLNNLKVFFFGGCDKMVDIPYGFEKLSSLDKLVLCLINSDSLLANVLSSLRHLALLDCRNLKSLPELPSSLIVLELIGCNVLEKLPNLSSLKNLRELNLTGCRKLEEIQGLEELKSLILYDVTLCYCLTESPMKVQGQGTLKDESNEYEFGGDIIHTNFVIGDDKTDKRLVMCLAFSSCHSTIDSCFHGVSDDCILQFGASISRSGRQIHCMNDLVININLPDKDEMFIYIHYFQGCDWFGFPLLHGDVIDKLQISSFTGEWSMKFFHLSVENMLQTPSQQPSVETVKDFFNWTDEIDS